MQEEQKPSKIYSESSKNSMPLPSNIKSEDMRYSIFKNTTNDNTFLYRLFIGRNLKIEELVIPIMKELHVPIEHRLQLEITDGWLVLEKKLTQSRINQVISILRQVDFLIIKQDQNNMLIFITNTYQVRLFMKIISRFLVKEKRKPME